MIKTDPVSRTGLEKNYDSILKVKVERLTWWQHFSHFSPRETFLANIDVRSPRQIAVISGQNEPTGQSTTGYSITL